MHRGDDQGGHAAGATHPCFNPSPCSGCVRRAARLSCMCDQSTSATCVRSLSHTAMAPALSGEAESWAGKKGANHGLCIERAGSEISVKA